MAGKLAKGLDAFALDKELGYTIQDFSPDRDEVAPVGNAGSNNSLAAYSAVLGASDPNDVVANYMKINNEQSLIGQSHTQTELIGQVKSVAQQEYVPNLMDTLADPTIDDETKKRAASAVLNLDSALYNPQNLLFSKAVIAPTKDSDPEQDLIRVGLGKASQSITASKIENQKVYNQIMGSFGDPTSKDKVVNFIRSLIPFADRAINAKIAAGIDPEHAKSAAINAFLTLPGDYKKRVRDLIARADPAKKQELMSKLADVINSNYGDLSANPDYFAARKFLQDTLNTEGYYPTEDNINGVLDAAAMTGLVGDVAKAGSIVGKTGRAAKDFSSAEKAFTGGYGSVQEDFIKNYNAQTSGWKSSSYDPGTTPPTSGQKLLEGPEMKPGTPEATVSNTKRDVSRSTVQPASVSQVVKDANVDVARSLNNAVDKDVSGGKVAQATYGTTRDEALASDSLPEVGHADGTVKSKVSQPDGIQQLEELKAQVPDELLHFKDHDGLTQYTQNEIAKTSSWKVNNIEQAIAFNPRPEMFQVVPGTDAVNTTSTGFNLKGVYGPMNSGYSNPKEALEIAEFALRNTGIPKGDITLLKRVGDKYVPTTLENELGKADPGFHVAGSNVNASIKEAYKAGNYAEATVKGKKIRLVGTIHNDNAGTRTVTAFDENGKLIGRVDYEHGGDGLSNPDLKVAKDHRRQGVATAMYRYAEKHGTRFPSADTQEGMRTTAGNAFRKALDGPNSPPVVFNGGGEYLIGINHNYTVTPRDFKKSGAADKLTYKNNFFDRGALTSGTQGTLASTLVDYGSILPPNVWLSSLAASDKSKFFEKQLLHSFATSFATPFGKLPRERQLLLEDEIHKANEQSRDFNFASLKASGATNEEINILNAWKKHQDILYVLRNELFGKYLSGLGYKEFVHNEAQTSLIAKPVKQGSLDIKRSGFSVYDPIKDQNIVMTPEEIDNVYKKGGTLAELRNKFVDGNGSIVSHVLDGNAPNGGYLKTIIPGESQLLSYRPGYFGVEYKDRHIIMRKSFDPKGNVVSDGAVASAKDLKSANLYANRMNATSNGDQFYVRKNRDTPITKSIADDYDIAFASGQSASRRRGKRLEGVNSNSTDFGNLHIKNPIDVFVRSTRSLANKISFADVIASQDIRNAAQFGHLLPKVDGMTVIPADRREIYYRGIGNESSSEIADARSAIQYTNFLRNTGYLSMLDDATKAGLRELADFMGEKNLAMSERLFSGLSDISISKVGKTAAYTAYLALSPLRQFLVQSSQVALLNAINPTWMATKFIPTMLYASMRQMGLPANHPISSMLAQGFGLGTTWKEADVIWKQFLRSGVSSAIDSNNMVSGVLSDMASRMVKSSYSGASAPIKAAKKGMHAVRLVGFDAGEWINSAASWFAHRDKASKTPGIDMNDPRVLDDVTGRARNYTGSMNPAGDMPQNQNILSLVAQFTQQAQKMLLNMTLNRNLSFGQKTTMAILLIGLFGLPTSLVYSEYMNDVLPDDPNDPSHQKLKEALDSGLVGYTLNHIMSAASGEDVKLDVSGSLNPMNVQGTYDLIHNVLTNPLGNIIANTPAGSLFFGNNPRILNFLKSIARYTNVMDDHITDPTTFAEVAKSFAKISSGYSAYAKAVYAMEYKKKMSSSGRFTDRDVSNWEAGAAIFGIQTQDEKRGFNISNTIYANRTQKEADFEKWYKDFKTHLMTKYENEDIQEYYTKVISEFARIYGNDPVYHRWLDKKLKQDIANGDDTVYQNLLYNSQLFSRKGIHALIDEAPFKDEQRRVDLKKTIDSLNTTDPTEK